MKVLVLVGSGDEQSHSLALGEEIEQSLNAKGANVELVNLAEYKLPVYDRAVERAGEWDDKTVSFLNKTREADAYVWVTPIYHNSFSGILKNALDWQHFFMDGKVVGLVSNGGNRSAQAVDQLMIIARAQHLLATRIRVCADGSDFEDLKLVAEDIKKRINDFCDELIELTGQVS
jgi:azobenzene reductase